MRLVEDIPSAAGEILRARTLNVDDLPRVMEIERRSFSAPWKESTFRGLLRRDDADLVAAVRGEQLLGYAVAWTVLDQAELGNVAVAHSRRGEGIGRFLVAIILRKVRVRGASECFLEVRESNLPAQAMYRSLGFGVVGRRRAYYSLPAEDALIMRAPLEPSHP
ncbi:MAG: ribosomal protein S18-alanine N-acetyltransferase [Gemmatimonadota bacterium]|nr:ribosomal protein S18-alanine N-acetyltransferase [Gemmatimonadota bacterium]